MIYVRNPIEHFIRKLIYDDSPQTFINIFDVLTDIFPTATGIL